MTKKIIKFITVIMVITIINFILSSRTRATTSTPSATPEDANKLKQIDDLKERLATKVAQLQQLQRRAIFGTVKAITLTNFTVETKTKDFKIELPDEIKIYQNISGKRTILSIDDLAKGDVVTVFGNYDTTLDLLKAKVIFIQGKILTRINGTIKEIDKADFSFTLMTPEGTTYIVDIENFTKTFTWEKDKGLVKSGFSKINSGDIVHVLGLPVPKKDNRLSAYRIVDLGDLTGKSLIVVTPVPSPTPKLTISPTP